MDPQWYRSFFQGVVLDMWRNAISPAQTASEVTFLEGVFAKAEGRQILDVPCGNGRHALELASRGYAVTGVDLAADYLQEAREKARATGASVEVVGADMRALPWQGRFDGAYCFGNSFGYLQHAETESFLAALARALKPGARFVLESGAVAETLLPALAERRWYQVGDIRMLIANQYDAAHSRLDTEFTFLRGGATDVRSACQHVYTAAEIGRLLAAVGLQIEDTYGATDRSHFKLGSPRFIGVAVKAGS